LESIVIHAVSLESAEGFCAALAAFEARLVEVEDGRYEVEVPLHGSREEILAALGALEDYVSRRGDPARLNLGEKQYTLHPSDPQS
jgi:hypothetical protein